jgi:hypothetical protein
MEPDLVELKRLWGKMDGPESRDRFDQAFEETIKELLGRGLTEREVTDILVPVCNDQRGPQNTNYNSWNDHIVLRIVVQVKNPTFSYNECSREAMKFYKY